MNSKPSKSARKRDTLALQALGERLVGITPEQLKSIGLDQALIDAVVAAKSMRARGALRRQKQLIGKLMRDVDPAPIIAALEDYTKDERLEKEIFRNAEQWRQRLTSGDPTALVDFAEKTGRNNDSLIVAVNNWVNAPNEKAKRSAGRAIFREVHKDLTIKMQTAAKTL